MKTKRASVSWIAGLSLIHILAAGLIRHLETRAGVVARITLVLRCRLLVLILVLFLQLVCELLGTLVVFLDLLVQLLVWALAHGSILLVRLQCLGRVILRLAKVLRHGFIVQVVEGWVLLGVCFAKVIFLRRLSSLSDTALTCGVILAIGRPVNAVSERLATTAEDWERPKPLI